MAQFIKSKFKISEARKKWINLANKYSLRNRNDDIFTVINNIKQYIGLKKMRKSFIHNARIFAIKLFKDKIRKNNIVYLLGKIIPERNDNNCYDILTNYFKKWRLNSQKLKKREIKLNKVLEAIGQKDTKKNLNIINNIMLVKKIFNDIPKIRAKLFLRKLKKIKINKKKYEKFKKY